MKQKAASLETGQSILKEYQSLVGARANWEGHWQEIAERIWPQQSKLFNNQFQNSTTGEKRNEFVFDSTASIGLNRFASILDSLLTPQNQVYHRLVASDKTLMKDRETALWFDTVNELLFKYRYAPTANFTSQNQLIFKGLGAYGSGCLYIDPYINRSGKPDGFRYRSIHLSGVYFRENHQGIVDSAIRYFKLTARQAAQEWPDTLPDQILEAAKNKPDNEYYFVHCVKPRADFDPERRDSKGLFYGSYWVSVTGAALLGEGGYDVFPYAISRYEQVPGEVYGRSPAMDLLPAIKTLNEQKKTILKQGHRALDPILLAHDDGIVDAWNWAPGSIIPGGVDANGRPLVQAVPSGNIVAGKELMDDERAQINDAFLITLFQIMTESPQMTATEVMERTREKGILLAPTVGRQESEYLGPMVDRELSLLAEQKKIPPYPQALLEAKGEYQIQYESPMARAARSESAAGFMRTIEMALNIANQAQNPAVLDPFNFDEIIPDVMDIQGLPERWKNGKDQIAAIRQGRAAQMQQEAQVRAAPGAAAMVKSVATAQKMNNE